MNISDRYVVIKDGQFVRLQLAGSANNPTVDYKMVSDFWDATFFEWERVNKYIDMTGGAIHLVEPNFKRV